MIRKRIIPVLQLYDGSLVKSINFHKLNYIGDPVNTVRIFNESEADELVFLDLMASKRRTEPDYRTLEKIASQCFMPLSYGGNVDSVATAKKIFNIGFEKIIINSHAYIEPEFVVKLSKIYGSQAIVGGIDIMKGANGDYQLYSESGSQKQTTLPRDWISNLIDLGVGEILITDIDREGTWSGFDINYINSLVSKLQVPVILHGGAGETAHINAALSIPNVTGVGLGSMVCYQKQGCGVLVNYPKKFIDYQVDK